MAIFVKNHLAHSVAEHDTSQQPKNSQEESTSKTLEPPVSSPSPESKGRGEKCDEAPPKIDDQFMLNFETYEKRCLDRFSKLSGENRAAESQHLSQIASLTEKVEEALKRSEQSRTSEQQLRSQIGSLAKQVEESSQLSKESRASEQQLRTQIKTLEGKLSTSGFSLASLAASLSEREEDIALLVKQLAEVKAEMAEKPKQSLQEVTGGDQIAKESIEFQQTSNIKEKENLEHDSEVKRSDDVEDVCNSNDKETLDTKGEKDNDVDSLFSLFEGHDDTEVFVDDDEDASMSKVANFLNDLNQKYGVNIEKNVDNKVPNHEGDGETPQTVEADKATCDEKVNANETSTPEGKEDDDFARAISEGLAELEREDALDNATSQVTGSSSEKKALVENSVTDQNDTAQNEVAAEDTGMETTAKESGGAETEATSKDSAEPGDESVPEDEGAVKDTSAVEDAPVVEEDRNVAEYEDPVEQECATKEDSAKQDTTEEEKVSDTPLPVEPQVPYCPIEEIADSETNILEQLGIIHPNNPDNVDNRYAEGGPIDQSSTSKEDAAPSSTPSSASKSDPSPVSFGFKSTETTPSKMEDSPNSLNGDVSLKFSDTNKPVNLASSPPATPSPLDNKDKGKAKENSSPLVAQKLIGERESKIPLMKKFDLRQKLSQEAARSTPENLSDPVEALKEEASRIELPKSPAMVEKKDAGGPKEDRPKKDDEQSSSPTEATKIISKDSRKASKASKTKASKQAKKAAKDAEVASKKVVEAALPESSKMAEKKNGEESQEKECNEKGEASTEEELPKLESDAIKTTSEEEIVTDEAAAPTPEAIMSVKNWPTNTGPQRTKKRREERRLQKLSKKAGKEALNENSGATKDEENGRGVAEASTNQVAGKVEAAKESPGPARKFDWADEVEEAANA